MINYQKVDHTFQAKNWLKYGWKLFKKKPLTWIFMVLIFDLFMLVGNSFFIGKFIVALLLPILAGGIFIALDKTSRDEPIGLENLFSVFKYKPILKELLTVGAIGVAVVSLTLVLQYLTGTEYEVKIDSSKVEGTGDVYKQVSKGSIFTSIVSLVWSCAMLFAIPLIAIYKESAIPALKHSLNGILLNFIPFLVFFGMIVLLTIVSILPVGLGLLVLIPVLYGAFYSSFKEIYVKTEKQDLSEAVPDSAKNKQEEKQSEVYTNNKKPQETDLKKTYQVIRIFKMVGIALITLGVMIAAYTFYSLQIGTNVMGEVLSVETHRSGTSSNRSTSYTPTFSFIDKHGEQHTAPTSYGSSSLNYPVGSRVEINYNPDDYSTVQINSAKSVFYTPMILWLLGGVLVWMTKKMKKDVDENGVPPRKSLFLKETMDATNVTVEKDKSQNIKPGRKQDMETSQNKVMALGLPKKFTLNLYENYMHITLSWFGKKTFVATLIAVFHIGFSLVFFISESTTMTGSPLMIKLAPWISTILGLGILYYALTTWLNKTHIFVSQNAIEVKHKPLPWFGNKRLETKNIKQLYSKEVLSTSTSSSRSTISYHLHVISSDEDDMTLMNVENSEQALFLEQEIEKYLGIENLKVRGEIG